MRCKFASVVLTLLLMAGCQQDKLTDKQKATARWNEARATILYGVAQDQYKAHDFDKCKETATQALAMTPDSPKLHTLLAKVNIEQGQLELAEKELEIARRFDPGDPEPYYLSGVIYQRWQKPQIALEFYRQASERAPAELAYVMARGEMLVALGRQAEALTLLQSKVAYFENSASIRDAVGQLLVQSGRYSDAVEMFRQATVLSEDDQAIRERLAMAYYYNKQYREAAEALTKLTQTDAYSKRADLFEMLGESQMHLNDSHRARHSFETATELNPYSAQTWRSFGRASLEAGELQRADLALRRSLGLDASAAETHLLLGYVRLKEGKLPEALKSFRQASALDDHDTTSLCMVGYTYEKLGQTEKAMEYYGRALKINPGDDMASQLMAGVEK